MPLIECVPNFSEGRREPVIAALRDAIAAVAGVRVLDVSADASHNRTVITFVGPPDAILDGAFAGIRAARELIDLREHQGVHPRIGAADVVPFVPLEGATMEQCIVLARTLAERVGRELGIPVYLYDRAASREDRVNLAQIRRGGFEELREVIAMDPARAPDFGPPHVHFSAGAVCIGARRILVAYNVYIGPESHLGTARAIAREIRESSGGRPGLRALGLAVDGQAQVSMNLVDLERTTLHDAWEAVRAAAVTHGIEPTWSEIVGLAPEAAFIDAAARHLRLRGDGPAPILEHRIREKLATGDATSARVGRHVQLASDDSGAIQRDPRDTRGVRDSRNTSADLLDALGADSPTPGGGSASAHAGAVGAAMARMVASITARKLQHAARADRMQAIAERAAALVSELSELVVRDAAVFEQVRAAHRLPRDREPAEARQLAIDAAFLHAAEIPLETARRCAEAAELCAELAAHGHPPARADAAVGALIAEGACAGCALNVHVNIQSMRDRAAGEPLLAEAAILAMSAAQARAAVLRLVTEG